MKSSTDTITVISTAALVAIGVALVALALGGCGSKESTKSAEPEVSEQKASPVPSTRARPRLPERPALQGDEEDRPHRERPRLDGEKWNSPEMAQRREEMMKRRGEMMKEYDADGDGTLDQNERTAMRTARMEEMFTTMDTDGDGQLSRDEAEARNQRGQRLRDFEGIDADGDGFVSQEEMQNMPIKGRPGRGMQDEDRHGVDETAE